MDRDTVRTFLQVLNSFNGVCTFDDIEWGRRINKDSNTKEDRLVVYYGDIAGQQAVVKMMVYKSFPPLPPPPDVKAFFMEQRIYMDVINDMILKSECGNLVPAVSTRACDRGDVAVNLPFIPSRVERVDALITLVPPSYHGQNVNDLLKNNPSWTSNASLLRPIVFQMLYTLAACHERGLTHNDNHLGNWLVGKAANPLSQLRYVVSPTHMYSTAGSTCVYLLDWDRGYKSDMGNNALLDQAMCQRVGACNQHRPYRDIFQTLCQLSQALKSLCKPNTPIGGVLHNLSRKLEEAQKVKCSGRADDPERKKVCHILEDENYLSQFIPPAKDLLMDPFFENIRVPQMLQGKTDANTLTFTLPSARTEPVTIPVSSPQPSPKQNLTLPVVVPYGKFDSRSGSGMSQNSSDRPRTIGSGPQFSPGSGSHSSSQSSSSSSNYDFMQDLQASNSLPVVQAVVEQEEYDNNMFDIIPDSSFDTLSIV